MQRARGGRAATLAHSRCPSWPEPRWGVMEERGTIQRATRVEELERQIADLKARIPKHSVPPAMVMELEELEAELERARAQEEGR